MSRRSPVRRLAALIAAGAASWVTGATAQDAALAGQCFARVYDSAHLAGHPGQDVIAMTAVFLEYEGELAATVRFTTRGGERFFFSGTFCTTAAAGGFSCGVCLHDGCEPTGETVRLMPRGAGELLLYNDTSGVTGVVPGGSATRRLDPGGEHRVFLMRREPAAACEG